MWMTKIQGYLNYWNAKLHFFSVPPRANSRAITNRLRLPVTSVASSAVFPRNWASFDMALLKKFSGRELWFFGLFFAIPFRYFWLVFGVTISVKVSDNGVLYGGQYRRRPIFVSKTA